MAAMSESARRLTILIADDHLCDGAVNPFSDPPGEGAPQQAKPDRGDGKGGGGGGPGGGLTLRHTANGYLAEPSHGGALAGDQQFAFRQCALINKGGVQIQPCEDVLLDDWAIRGRVDAIREQMKRLLGDKYDRVPEQFWKHWDKFLRGVMSQPWQSATVAYSIKFLLKYDFVEQLTDAECDVFSTIADILSEGTTEKDIPVQVLEMFRSAEERFDQNPDELADFKQMMRRYFERMSELERKRHGG